MLKRLPRDKYYSLFIEFIVSRKKYINQGILTVGEGSVQLTSLY
jgi:hypothetical protein